MEFTKVTTIKWLTLLAILASCSSPSINYQNDSSDPIESISERNIIDYFSYQEFHTSDLKRLEDLLNISNLQGKRLAEARLLNRNLLQIKSRKSYALSLNLHNKYSADIIELIFKLNLPLTISWKKSNKQDIFKNLFSGKISGFCKSLHGDALASIYHEIQMSPESTLIIYSPAYKLLQSEIKNSFPQIDTILLSGNDVQTFAAILLGIEESNERFEKINRLNPNEKLMFIPRARADRKKIVLLLDPDKYKSLLPALRYHGGKKFDYINFISAIENVDNSKQLLDFEGSLTPLSFYLSSKIQNLELRSMERILEKSVLNDWLLVQILEQSGVRFADINGMTGRLKFQKNNCTKRKIPLQKIEPRWLAS